MIKEALKKEIDLTIKELYPDSNTDAVTVEVSDNFGDYASNAALVLANQINKSTSSYISSLPDRQAGSARISESKASPSPSLYVANKTTLGSLQTIPKDDQKQLAELWPKKYDTNASKSSIVVKKTEEPAKNDDYSVNETTEKEVVGVNSNVDPALIKYIQETRALGFDDKEIEEELKRAGWDTKIIESALESVANLHFG